MREKKRESKKVRKIVGTARRQRQRERYGRASNIKNTSLSFVSLLQMGMFRV